MTGDAIRDSAVESLLTLVGNLPRSALKNSQAPVVTTPILAATIHLFLSQRCLPDPREDQSSIPIIFPPSYIAADKSLEKSQYPKKSRQSRHASGNNKKTFKHDHIAPAKIDPQTKKSSVSFR
jgi:hypothetical protein